MNSKVNFLFGYWLVFQSLSVQSLCLTIFRGLFYLFVWFKLYFRHFVAIGSIAISRVQKKKLHLI